MHSAGLELTKLTYTRLEDDLIRHRGDRHILECDVNTLAGSRMVVHARCCCFRPVFHLFLLAFAQFHWYRGYMYFDLMM